MSGPFVYAVLHYTIVLEYPSSVKRSPDSCFSAADLVFDPTLAYRDVRLISSHYWSSRRTRRRYDWHL